MKPIPRIASIAVLAIVSGCASPATKTPGMWSQEGKSPQQVEQDLAACRLVARTQPGALQKNAAWYFATRDGVVSDDAVKDCMIAKGYHLIYAPK